MKQENPLVGVIMGSASDAEVMKGCTEMLQRLEIPHEVRVLSAHRTPEQARAYVEGAEARGIAVLIAGAGWAAHLAGFVAAHCTLPVIGIPIDSSPLNGVDALYSTVMMPPGIPVATMAVGKGGARNAAVLAAQILGVRYPDFARRVKEYREALRRQVMEGDPPRV